MEKRKLKIALSLAVLIPCVLYIAGIIAQFMININAWKAAGSDYSVSPGLPSLELADVFRSIFHFPEGLIAIGVVVVGIVLICIFWTLDRMGPKRSHRFRSESHCLKLW